MTIHDPVIHIQFGPSHIVLVGTPEEYSIRSNNDEFTKIAKYAARNPTLVRYGNKKDNTYLTGNKTMEELFLSLVSILPGQAVVIQAPFDVAEKFWDKEPETMVMNENPYITRS